MFNRVIKPLCFATLITASMGVASLSEAEGINNNTVLQQAADEQFIWQRTPINITLPVDKERFISFPSEVQFGYNTNLLPPSVLRVENDNQTLYLTAKKSFSMQRVEAKLANGEIILLDINAKKQASDNPIDIVLPKMKSTKHSANNNTTARSVSYVTLIRYAAQQFYAPKRLLKNAVNLTRFPMETTHVVPLFYDGSVLAMPLASWRGGDLYVTALLIKNTLDQPLRLDPRLLCGHWKAASFFPQTQLPSRATSTNRDTSTLFVISDRPFSQAIHLCLN